MECCMCAVCVAGVSQVAGEARESRRLSQAARGTQTGAGRLPRLDEGHQEGTCPQTYVHPLCVGKYG